MVPYTHINMLCCLCFSTVKVVYMFCQLPADTVTVQSLYKLTRNWVSDVTVVLYEFSLNK